jgi:hypothetical protein
MNILNKFSNTVVMAREVVMMPTQFSTSFTNFRTDPPPELEGRPMLRVQFVEVMAFEKVRKLFRDAGLGDAVINPKWQDSWKEEKDGQIIFHWGKVGPLCNDSACLYFDLPYLEKHLEALKVLERVGPRNGMQQGK